MNKLILASSSPYRRALLEKLCLPFAGLDPGLDEQPFKEKISDPEELTATLAYEKAFIIHNLNPEAVVIGGDQVSLFENSILGKPGNNENAFAQLKLLQGKTHHLVTAVCLIGPNGREAFIDKTTLKMRALTDREISSYIEMDNPLDCAGSYKIEKLGISLFDSIDTEDHTAIVGLPLMKLSKVLRGFGFALP